MSDNENDEDQQQQNLIPGDSLGPLHIRRMFGRTEIVYVLSGAPIPSGPIPFNIVGFEKLKISYIDRSVIEFLQSIRRLFDASGTTIAITTFANQNRSWEIIWHQIWPFFNDNIHRLVFNKFRFHQLDAFRQFSPAILRNCANLWSLSSYDLFPEFPADDNAGASSAQAVAKWLLTPLHDGRPKILQCEEYTRQAMYSLQRAFRNATEPAAFILQMFCRVFEPFDRKNTVTGERLTFRRVGDFEQLVRCPIAREEAKWAKWEAEALIPFYNAKVEIDLMDTAIDDVNPPVFCSVA